MTGAGAIGVEFAGTAVTSSGKKGPIEPTAGNSARKMIKLNDEMMWQEGYYRGYFQLTVSPKKASAQFFGMFPRSKIEAPGWQLANIKMKALRRLQPATRGISPWPTSPSWLATTTCSALSVAVRPSLALSSLVRLSTPI